MNAADLAVRAVATGLDASVLIGLAVALEFFRVQLGARLAVQPVSPWAQPLRDLVRLTRKRRIRPEFASPLHGVWPLTAAAATLTLALLVPGFATHQITARFASMPLIVGLLAIARAARVLAALDSGAGKQGRVAARTAFAGIRGDVVWLLAFAALGLADGSGPLGAMGSPTDMLVVVLAVIGVLLTRADEAIVPGDYAGPDRAIFMAEAMLRRALFLVILIDLAVPAGLADAVLPLSWPLGFISLLAKFLVAAVVLGVTTRFFTNGAPAIGFVSALAALAVALLRPVPVPTLALAGGAALMIWGVMQLWRRRPAIEATVLVQGGLAIAGFGLGAVRGGWIILIGLGLARLAASLAGRGLLGLCCLVALAGLPPFGLFAGDFTVIGAAGRLSAFLAAGLTAGLVLGAVRLVGLPAQVGGTTQLHMGRVVTVILLLALLVALGAAPLPGFLS